ncbi:MAG: hypothetical protein ACKO5P_00400 [Nodosilinea sp.]
MNLPVVLDIALGLTFIFLVLSLLASEIQEIIGALLQWRAEHLKQSIEVLLSGNDRDKEKAAQALADALYDSPWIRSLNQEAKGRIARSFRSGSQLIGRIYRFITGGRNIFGAGKTSGPSYIPAEAFANSLLERMQLGRILQVLADERMVSFIADKVLLPVHSILSDLRANTGNEFLLNPELQQLETSLQEILQDFKTRLVSLPDSLDRLIASLDQFMAMAQHALPEGHPLTTTFLRRLDYIQRGLTSTPAERNALINRLRPSISSLLEVFDTTSEIYRELSQLANQGNLSAQGLVNQLEKIAITPGLKDSLTAIARKVDITSDNLRSEVEQFGREIEKWFDRGMERATGVYKRNAKAVAVIIGIGTAIAINADSFHIATRLAKDPLLRSTVTQAADQLVAHTNAPNAQLSENLTQVKTAVDQALQEIPFPIGYDPQVIEQQQKAEQGWPLPLVPRRFLGWLVSGLAISMGSNFWFDVLKKVVNIRNSGKQGD